jgi:hypothetical protein
MKYRINYTMERWYRVEIEAGSEDEALVKFHNGEHPEPELTGDGDYLQESVEIEEVEE